MIELASHETCTGCGACAFKCAHNAISMEENSIGEIYPVINRDACIDCHLCEKSCPVLHIPESHKPCRAYAACSNEESVKLNSSSGGVSMEAYLHALDKEYVCVGAAIQDDFTVKLQTAMTKEHILPFQESKYVFSYAYGLYPEVKDLLKQGRKILVIALPCQIASLRSLFHDNENLILIEVVCHGTTPTKYLHQHIRKLERKYNTKASHLTFRDPVKGTSLFYFSLYDSDGKCFYSQRTKDGDNYQYGYHRNINYRESCYHCTFAQQERQADITLNDFKFIKGLTLQKWNSGINLNTILINTKKGELFINELISSGKIEVEECDVKYPLMADERLRQPTRKSADRLLFEKRIYRNGGDFESAIEPLKKKYILRQNIRKIKSKIKVVARMLKG